ncbi:hypothetical protein GGX14DRAFT_186435 [Mycena pura]|uniref:Uncharacterized protein n=1 Tax=Mycena pura TaxID=153505 RepID=A0AAD6V011_9AGAR|nr:hypothetical protein GGX14DRAFT_186435 [Mycena pura]
MFPTTLITSMALVLALAGSARGCLRIVGNAAAEAFGQSVSFRAIDNGVEVCHFSGGGQGYATCIPGYSLHFNYHDNPVRGPLPMTYHNPQNGFELRVPMSCSFSTGCCPFPNAPCTCADCKFDHKFFESAGTC